VVVVVGFVVGLGVWNWGEEQCLWTLEPQLGPIVRDPLADKGLLGLTLISSSERTGHKLDNFMAISPSCQTIVRRTFGSGPDGSAATVGRIVESAEENGWIVTKQPPSSAYWVLVKPYGGSLAKSVNMSGRDGDDSVLLSFIWVSNPL
jgi:hypothetical protein